MNQLDGILETLIDRYAPLGWWPLPSKAHAPGFTARGYHPGLFDYPRTEGERWEIICGAILTQNTAWTNVEKALAALRSRDLVSPQAILSAPLERLAETIQPSGYYNQKTLRLHELARFFIALSGRVPSRAELLALNGVGPETADSILLYAWSQAVFVVDAYTIRLLLRFGAVEPDNLPKTPSKRYKHVQYCITNQVKNHSIAFYQEAHAAIVENAKHHCAARAKCPGCPLEQRCKKVL